MILALIRYYWQILKYGKPLPTQERNPVYGKEELSQNQHWYGFTALGLVMGIIVSISLLALHYMNQKEEFQSSKVHGYIGCLGFDLYPPPPHQAHAKGELAMGSTQVNFMEFRIPKPAPREKVIEEGIRKDIKVRDPEGDDNIKDWTCELHLPDSLDSQQPLMLSDVDFDVPEPDYSMYESGVGEPELICDCLPKFPHDISFMEPRHDLRVDEEAIPVNLDEVKKLIQYPRQFCGSGTVILRMFVDKYGSLTGYKVISESHPLLTKEVVKHIEKLSFTPAVRRSEPVAFFIDIPFRFKLIQ